MMSIGTALTTATTLVGPPLPAGSLGQRVPARAPRAAGTGQAEEAKGALLVAIEAGLREAGYLSARGLSA